VKKLFAILLFLIYLPATTGLAVNSFYCCGKLASVDIQMAPKKAAAGKEGKQGNCCNNTTSFFKVHDFQQSSVFDIVIHSPVVQIPAILPAPRHLLGPNFSWKDSQLFGFHSPPLLDATASYIRNSCFLI
jgi:hypothetical protein